MDRKAWLTVFNEPNEPVTVIAILPGKESDRPIAVIIRENGQYDVCSINLLTERKEK